MASLSGMQGVTVTPRYIFGVNAQIGNSLHLVEGNKLLYVAGHNVVIQDDDKTTQQSASQSFIPGTEGVDRICSIAVSNKAPLLAICEAKERNPRCTIWNLSLRKNIKTIPE